MVENAVEKSVENWVAEYLEFSRLCDFCESDAEYARIDIEMWNIVEYNVE